MSYTPKVPNRVRDWAYAAGILLGIGATPSLLAAGLEVPAAITGAMSGACNALAFAYRPGKPPEGWTGDTATDG